MRLLSGLLLALALVLPSAVLAQASTASTEQEAAKASGAQAALDSQAGGYELNPDGSVKLDAQGQPIPKKDMTQEERMRYFQSMTGMQGAEVTADPGRGMRTGVSASTETTADVSCSLGAGSQVAAGGVVFQFGGCRLEAGGKVGSMSLRVCTKSQRGGTCQAAADFAALVLTEGRYEEVGGNRYGLGCNNTGLCRVSVKGTYAIGGTGEELAQAAQEKVATADGTTYTDGLRNVLTNPEQGYAERIATDGAAMQECHQRSRESVKRGGPIIDCNGNVVEGVVNTGTANGGETPAACGEAPKCLRYADSASTFVKSCVRTFPVTVRSTKLSYEQTAECTVTSVRGKVTNSCDKPDPEPPEWKDKRDDKTLVGTSERECSTVLDGDGLDTDPETCRSYTQTEYYVDLRTSAAGTLSVSASPSPVSTSNPKCDDATSPAQRTCDGGDWFGRTKPDSECTALYEDNGEVLSEALDFRDAGGQGCGFCIKPTLHSTCYGQPSEDDEEDTCSGMDLSQCTLKEVKPGATSDDDGAGIVIDQEEIYSCSKEASVCLEYAPKSAECQAATYGTASTFGLDQTASGAGAGDGSFGNAMASAAVVDGIAKGIQESANDDSSIIIPRIFSGEELKCSRPTGGLGGLLSKNCCRTDLQRPKKGNIVRRGCGDEEVKLAAARRANVTYYIGDYCSKKMRFPKKCLRRTQTYCAFQGTLARIVQVEGRKQLADIASKGEGAELKRAPFNFSYYSATPQGGWSTPLVLNGVRLSAWQYPNYCRSSEATAKAFAANPGNDDCPGSLTLMVAACDAEQGCGALPQNPTDGVLNWSLQSLNPLANVTTAVSRYSAIKGACDPSSEQCTYEAFAWPVGQGGKVTVTRDFSFELYSNRPVDPQARPSPVLGNVADIMFQAYSTPGLLQSALPATVRIDVSNDGGQQWTRMAVPTSASSETLVPGTDIKLTGGCRLDANICTYRMTGTTVLEQKRWGDAKNPDCTGFTAGQISAMDFGRMDLSEWITEVVAKADSKAKAVDGSSAADAIKAQMSVYNNANGNVDQSRVTTQTGQRPGSLVYAYASPGEGYGPFKVTLRASGRFPFRPEAPESGDYVNSVEVDWGDCSTPETLTVMNSYQGQPAHGFFAEHRYAAPNDDQHTRCGVGKENTVLHKLKLKVYTSKGINEVSLEVKNSWNSVSGNATGNIGAVTEETSTTVNKTSSTGP